ncbi:MAG: hypothetical protein ACO3LZ_06910 [Candidatus Nanopelagicales bacterium]
MPIRKSTSILLASGLLASSFALTGCFNGMGAQTNLQNSQLTGNGVQAQVGNVRAENLTLVAGPEGSGSATLITRIINGDPEPDALLGVQIGDSPAYVTGDIVELLPAASVGFGFGADRWINSYRFDADVSTYVPVTLQFERAGIVEVEVLVVPAEGYYEGIEPVPPAM